MAARGLKSGRCGGGQAGVLRGRVVGLERLPSGTSEARKETRTYGDRCNRSRVQPGGPDRPAAQRSILGLGDVLGRKPTPRAPFGSASGAHRGAGPKLNFPPACAASQRLGSPGAAVAKGGGEPGEPGQGRLSCHSRQKGRRRPPEPSEREAGGSTWLGGRDAALRAPRYPFGGGQLPAAAAPGRPGERLSRPRAAARAPTAGWLSPPRRPDKLPSSWALGSRRQLPRQAFQVSGLQAPPPGTASFLPAPVQPGAPGAQRSPRSRSNKAGGPAATRRGAGSGGGGGGARRRQPSAGRGRREAAAGTWRAETGEESVLPPARTPSLPLCSPCPSASACPGGSWQGQRGWQRGRSGLAGEPLLLPLSRVSGWTTVNVAMSAVRAEVTLGFSISL